MSKVIDHLRRVAQAGAEAEATDGRLLERFLSRRDQQALAELVQRHAPMVWGVCRRILGNHHDAEDAFQATFLVLVRRAGCVRPRDMVVNWLYGVAHQTALKARATMAKRRSREKQVNETPDRGVVTEVGQCPDLEPLLDHELSRLPAKYRVVIALCDLEGKSRKEAAHQLALPEGTVSSRLTTARKLLAKRLARHGLAWTVGSMAAALAHTASASVPVPVLYSTIKAATLVAAGEMAAAGLISARAAALTEGVVKAMLVTKLKMVLATAVFLVLGLVMITGAMQAWGQSSDHAALSAAHETQAPAAQQNDPPEPKVEPLRVQLKPICQKMLDMQTKVCADMKKIHGYLGDKKPGPKDLEDIEKLAAKQKEIIAEATKALEKTEADGTAAFLPAVINDLREDMVFVQRRLDNGNVGNGAQGVAEDVIDVLKKLKSALEKK